MSGKKRAVLAVVVLGGLALAGFVIFNFFYDVRTFKEYREPPVPADAAFADDPVPEAPPAFDPKRVDSRKLDGWEVNSSAAVIRLDCPVLLPDRDQGLNRLHPSYAAAIKAAADRGELLPSVNLIDGKAKQFDDGLYAAVDLAAFKGIKKRLAGLQDILERLAAKVNRESWAACFLDVALQLAGGTSKAPPSGPKLPGTPPTLSEAMLSSFFASETTSKPVGFYTWSEELKTLWRTERFLAHQFDGTSAFGVNDFDVVSELAAALKSDPQLLADYQKFVGLFRRLTNPYECLSLDELPAGPVTKQVLEAEAKKRGVRHAAVSFLPPSTSRENELVEKLWPLSGADLMRELITRIKSGEVDLKPTKNSGWYDYQVYALETLLIPGKGEEKDKLVLSARYKQRMKEAFEALITKRRETHSRAEPALKCAGPRPSVVRPWLRLEPNATYYLRTARAYAFVENLLIATFGEKELAALHGLRQENGKVADRAENLAAELAHMRALFYGFYLVACEDLGLAPNFLEGENVDASACKAAAEKWLAEFRSDPDLAADTRVAVPVIVEPDGAGTHLWATIGVRMMKLDAEYVFAPSIREPGQQEWKRVERYECSKAQYLIPVDTFAAFRLKGNRVLNREELRAACDQAGTREKFLKLMEKR